MFIQSANAVPMDLSPDGPSGPNGHDFVARVSKPTLSGAIGDIIYNIIEFDPSSVLTLAVACRAFTPVAYFFMRANTSAILSEHRGRDSGSSLSMCINNELEKDYAINLQLGNDDYRSCVIFHRSIGNTIRSMGFMGPNLILTPVELHKANNDAEERFIQYGMDALDASNIETLDTDAIDIRALERMLSTREAIRFITLVRARQNEMRTRVEVVD